MKQAPGFDGLSFDPFSLFQNGLAAPEVDVGRREVLQALVVAPMVVVFDEGVDLLSEIAGQVVILQQDAVLEGLVPALDLALGLGVIRGATDVIHLPIFQPICQLTRDVTRPVVTKQPRLVQIGTCRAGGQSLSDCENGDGCGYVQYRHRPRCSAVRSLVDQSAGQKVPNVGVRSKRIVLA